MNHFEEVELHTTILQTFPIVMKFYNDEQFHAL